MKRCFKHGKVRNQETGSEACRRDADLMRQGLAASRGCCRTRESHSVDGQKSTSRRCDGEEIEGDEVGDGCSGLTLNRSDNKHQ